MKQIVGSTLRDLPDDGNSDNAAALITNFESQLSAGAFAEMYKNDGLLGGHVIMLGADPASHAAALEALKAYPVCFQRRSNGRREAEAVSKVDREKQIGVRSELSKEGWSIYGCNRPLAAF